MTNTVTLPWPPKELSPNSRAHHMKLAAAKKKYKQECYLLTKQAGMRLIRCPYNLLIEFYPPDNRRRDLDNMLASIKAGLDGWAQAMGVDDRIFDNCHMVRRNIVGGIVKVSIVPLSSLPKVPF